MSERLVTAHRFGLVWMIFLEFPGLILARFSGMMVLFSGDAYLGDGERSLAAYGAYA
jgi:hypothetical protein